MVVTETIVLCLYAEWQRRKLMHAKKNNEDSNSEEHDNKDNQDKAKEEGEGEDRHIPNTTTNDDDGDLELSAPTSKGEASKGEASVGIVVDKQNDDDNTAEVTPSMIDTSSGSSTTSSECSSSSSSCAMDDNSNHNNNTETTTTVIIESIPTKYIENWELGWKKRQSYTTIMDNKSNSNSR